MTPDNTDPVIQLRQQLAECKAERESAIDTVARLLRNHGTPRLCPACRRPIVSVEHRIGGKSVLYDTDGTNHYYSCPHRQLLREGVKAHA